MWRNRRGVSPNERSRQYGLSARRALAPSWGGRDLHNRRHVLRRSPENAMDATAPRFAPRILAVLVNLLRVRRASVARCAEALRSEAANALSQRDLSDLWDDQGPWVDSDGSTSLMLVHRAERRLREVEEALTRVADGTYGYCIDCGAGIPLARLRALPATANCVKCSRRSSHRICELVYRDHVRSNKIRARSVAGHGTSVPRAGE